MCEFEEEGVSTVQLKSSGSEDAHCVIGNISRQALRNAFHKISRAFHFFLARLAVLPV